MQNRQNALTFFRSRQHEGAPDCFFVTDSGIPGPHLMIVAGVHGHEPVGVKAIIKFVAHLRDNNITLKRGKITWALGNPKAFKENKRFIDLNLNRAFTEQKEDLYEYIRAEEISDYIRKHKDSIDVLMDLHSVSVGDFTTVASFENPDLYQKLNQHTLMNQIFTFKEEHIPGLMIGYAQQFDILSFVLECGNNKDTQAYRTALAHINHLATLYDMLDHKDLPVLENYSVPEHVFHLSCLQPIKPKQGFQWLIPSELLRTGLKLEEGQQYAVAEGCYYTAPQDCELFLPDAKPNPKDHDVGHLCIRMVEERIHNSN